MTRVPLRLTDSIRRERNHPRGFRSRTLQWLPTGCRRFLRWILPGQVSLEFWAWACSLSPLEADIALSGIDGVDHNGKHTAGFLAARALQLAAQVTVFQLDISFSIQQDGTHRLRHLLTRKVLENPVIRGA